MRFFQAIRLAARVFSDQESMITSVVMERTTTVVIASLLLHHAIDGFLQYTALSGDQHHHRQNGRHREAHALRADPPAARQVSAVAAPVGTG